jgi:hypothetical protein
MGAYDRAAAARAKMAQVQREMADRRALRDRNFMQRREQAKSAFMKQGPVMAQVAKHMGELAKRQKQAGGWATEKTQRDKDFVMGFGGEEETGQNPYEFRPSRPASTDVPPGGIGTIDDEDASPLARSSQAPTPPPAPEAPPAPAPPAPSRPARRRPQPQELDDEDDFSNQSSWMQNR